MRVLSKTDPPNYSQTFSSLTLGGNHGHGGHRPQPYRPYRPQPVYSNGHDHHFNYPGVFTGGYGNGHGGYGGHGYRGPQ